MMSVTLSKHVFPLLCKNYWHYHLVLLHKHDLLSVLPKKCISHSAFFPQPILSTFLAHLLALWHVCVWFACFAFLILEFCVRVPHFCVCTLICILAWGHHIWKDCCLKFLQTFLPIYMVLKVHWNQQAYEFVFQHDQITSLQTQHFVISLFGHPCSVMHTVIFAGSGRQSYNGDSVCVRVWQRDLVTHSAP